MKEIKLDLNKWRDVTCSWIRKCNIVKMSIRPKLLYRFNVISVKITAIFFVDIYKLIIKYIWKIKELE